MTRKFRIADLTDFDPAEHLKDEDDVAAYLTVILEDNDPDLFAAALGDIARARGMPHAAQQFAEAQQLRIRRINDFFKSAIHRVLQAIRFPCSNQ